MQGLSTDGHQTQWTALVKETEYICMHSKSLSQGIYELQRRNYNLTVEKYGRQHLNQVRLTPQVRRDLGIISLW